MKKIKYLALAAGIASAVLVGAQNASAFETADGSAPEIKITNIDSSDTFKACKIAGVSNSFTSFYAFTDDFDSFARSDYNTTGINTIDGFQGLVNEDSTSIASGAVANGENTIDILAANYASYIAENSVSCQSMAVSGTTATLSDSEGGSYLIIPTSTKNIYSTMIASLEPELNNGEFVLNKEKATIVAKKSTPKALIKAVNKNTAAIGGEVEFEINVEVPNFPGNAVNKSITVIDQAVDSQGNKTFDFNLDSLTYTDASDGTLNINPTVSLNKATNELTIKIDDVSSLANGLVIKYKANLSEGARADENRANTAYYNYPENVYDYDSESAATEKSTVNVKTYGLEIHKINPSGSELSGAKIQIESLTNGKEVKCYDRSGILVDDVTYVNGAVQFTTGAKAFICNGLEPDTYKITEVTAPAGYMVATSIEVTITDDGYALVNGKDEGQLKEGYAVVVIVDSAFNLALPFTGGRGVAIFAVLGAAVALGASIVYIRKKN